MKYDEFVQEAEKLLFSLDFKELKAAIEFPEPNIWQILGKSRAEILVTRFLAWLLDPQAKNSFGDEFLKGFIVKALQTDVGRQSGLTPVEISVADLSDVEVDIEGWLGKRRCDILIYSEESGFICVIENKVGAKESDAQTEDYYKLSFEDFSQKDYPNRVYVYLSPNGDPPQSEHFIPLPYQALLDAVKDLQSKQHITDTEQFLLRQFQESVTRSIAVDQKTVDLAQEIYDTHRDVFNFVYKYVERSVDESDAPREWDGKSWFFNTGDHGDYDWEDYRQYSFICAGGGRKFRNLMERFKVEDVIYAYVSRSGYVGVGTVTKEALSFREATLSDGTRLADLTLAGTYNDSEDDDICDWIALVEWESNVGKSQAVKANPIVPATACRVFEDRKEEFINEVRKELKKGSVTTEST